MAISNFLNPEEEKDIQDGMEELGPEEVLKEVLEEHLGQGSTQDDDEEEEQLEQPVKMLSRQSIYESWSV
ncbi:hypothetical protein GMDG_05453 [Pseudogymnoascus destructans 20631-21]|uniref:Uncharacterized protein n=1 Tax=Pseudogymnoascus destructans (strain ATCC MYA-4855 / 20631-21) TaxID=658429 RepID=L8FN46_PSED2|nr:hypothetical protein GMDG_05453 [Pseudogymnoascus destructans 20631-21]